MNHISSRLEDSLRKPCLIFKIPGPTGFKSLRSFQTLMLLKLDTLNTIQFIMCELLS